MLSRRDIKADLERPTELKTSSVVRIYENMVIRIGKIRGQQIEALIDSGSTDNFVTNQFVEQSGLTVKGMENH